MKSAPQADGGAGRGAGRADRAGAWRWPARPTYDPAVWTGGISEREYRDLLSDKSGKPLVSRAINGQFAPGSTFKVSSVTSMLRATAIR